MGGNAKESKRNGWKTQFLQENVIPMQEECIFQNNCLAWKIVPLTIILI